MKGQETINGETIYYDQRTAELILFSGGDFIAIGEFAIMEKGRLMIMYELPRDSEYTSTVVPDLFKHFKILIGQEYINQFRQN